MKRGYYEVRPVGNRAFGVYSKDYGPEGGMHLLKTFYTEEEANEYVLKNYYLKSYLESRNT